MSHHQPYILCCAAHVCCDPPQAEALLADEIQAQLAELYEGGTDQVARSLSRWLYEHFDLVPKGVGAAIVQAYRPMFETAHQSKKQKGG